MTGAPAAAVDALLGFVTGARRLVVITGAGISTASGIPAYRDAAGNWQNPPPVQWSDFRREPRVRRRYWGRSIVGWPRFAAARPNAAHSALAALETAGIASGVITQNVDGLHQQAGSRAVIDLHGRLDGVRCLGCGARWTRGQFQLELEAANPGWQPVAADAGPDGDMQLADADYARFVVPDCRACGGIVRPAVVFFGESLAAGTADVARATTSAADRLLVVGSSLTVFSGYRLVRDAAAAGIPVAALCLGQSRADGLLHLRVAADCGTVLHEVATRLSLSIAPY